MICPWSGLLPLSFVAPMNVGFEPWGGVKILRKKEENAVSNEGGREERRRKTRKDGRSDTHSTAKRSVPNRCLVFNRSFWMLRFCSASCSIIGALWGRQSEEWRCCVREKSGEKRRKRLLETRERETQRELIQHFSFQMKWTLFSMCCMFRSESKRREQSEVQDCTQEGKSKDVIKKKITFETEQD